jgi:gas vesicle protein
MAVQRLFGFVHKGDKNIRGKGRQEHGQGRQEHMKSLLTGLGIGFGLGVLFAPMRGKDMREIAAVRASEMADHARQQYGQARDIADKAISSIRNVNEESSTGTEA